jgi:hypothetical protein
MNSLPIAPFSCSLDEPGLTAQLARYRAVGEGATMIERGQRRLVIQLGDAASDAAVEELVAVERSCCPFFELEWKPRERRLLVGVSSADDEPALDAIAYALGLGRAHRT